MDVDMWSVVNVLNYDDLKLVIIRPSTTILRLANNIHVFVEGVVEDVPVMVIGMTALVTFHVLQLSDDTSKYPLLLGRPWTR